MTVATINNAADIRYTQSNKYIFDDVLTNAKGGPEVGAKIDVIIDGVYHKVTNTTDANGRWFLDPGLFADGMHTIQILAVDKAGNRSGVRQYILDVDSKPPSQPTILRMFDDEGSEKGNFTPGKSTDDKTPVLSGVAEPGTTVTLYDGNTLIGKVEASSNGNWSITPSQALADGTHNFRVVATDRFGRDSVDSSIVTVEVAKGDVTLTSDLSDVIAHVAPPAGNEPIKGIVPLYQVSRTYHYDGDTKPGEIAVLTINGDKHTATADANGKYSFDIPNLADGTYAIQIRSVDKAGNWSEGAKNVILVVDQATPEKPEIIAVVDDNDTQERYLNSGEYTNDTSPELRGSAQPDSLVNIKIDGQIIASVQAGLDGSWSYKLPLTADDKYNISVNYVDRHGKTSADSDVFTLRLDNATLSQPTFDKIVDDTGSSAVDIIDGQATADKTPTLSGTADAGVMVRIWNGNTILTEVVADSKGNWQVDLNLTDGSYDIKVDSIGKGGNTSPYASKNFKLIIDTTTVAPAPIEHIYNDDVSGQPVEVANGGQTNDTTPLLTGSGKAGNIVYIFVKGTTDAIASVTIDANGKWSHQIASKLSDGTYEYSTIVKDVATGRDSAPSPAYSVIIDTLAPTTPGIPTIVDGSGSITGPLQPGEKTDDKRPVIGGEKAEEGDIVTIIDKDENGNETIIGTAIVDDQGKWTFKPGTDLGEGEHNIIIVITDPAGNESGKSTPIQIIIDTKAPVDLSNIELFDDAGSVHGPIVSGGKTDDATPTIRGEGDAGSIVNIYVDGKIEASVKVDANGKWTYDLKALSEAAHKVQVEAVSEAGVVGNKSAEIDFTVDVTPPALGSARFLGVYYDFLDGSQLDDFYALGNGADLGDLTPQFQGIGKPGDLVVVYGSADTSMPMGSAVVDVNGDWKIDSIMLTDETDYSFRAVIRDDAGNETAMTKVINTHTDTTPPMVPTSVGEVEVFELPEQLKTMSLNDILAHSDEALFIDNGKTQLIVNEKDGKELTLEDVLPKGEDASSWQQAAGNVTVAGVQYNVYENTTGEAQLLIEQHQQH